MYREPVNGNSGSGDSSPTGPGSTNGDPTSSPINGHASFHRSFSVAPSSSDYAGREGQGSRNGYGHRDPHHLCGSTNSHSVDAQNMKFGYHLAVPMGHGVPVRCGETAPSTSTPHVIAMVGLPARGKTYISKKLTRYLNWIGIHTKVFNLGDYRREEDGKYSNHQLFNPDNKEGRELRERVCARGLDDVLHWLEHSNGEVAIFDATNTTRARRKYLYDKVVIEKGFKLFFIESLCSDDRIIDTNIKEVKVTSPDYTSYSPDQVIEDFKERIRHYEKAYEELDETHEPKYSFLKVFNAGTKVLSHKHEGHIQSRIVYYMMNCHITPRTIYLTRHGESYNNIHGRIGGDSELSPRGEKFADKLGEFVKSISEEKPDVKIWTSWMKRTIDTASKIEGIQERWKTLNEIDSGVCDDLSYEEIKSRWPHDFESRDIDKFRYRYPRGESYEDLVARLEPVIMELERKDCVVVIAHQAVNRCLLGYFLEIPEDELPWQEIPLHTIIKLTPKAYGCGVEYIDLDVPCVSTHRSKPSEPGFLDKRFSIRGRPKHENIEGVEKIALSFDDHFCATSARCGKYKNTRVTSSVANGKQLSGFQPELIPSSSTRNGQEI